MIRPTSIPRIRSWLLLARGRVAGRARGFGPGPQRRPPPSPGTIRRRRRCSPTTSPRTISGAGERTEGDVEREAGPAARRPPRRQAAALVSHAGDSTWADYAVDLDVCGMRGVDKGVIVRVQGGAGPRHRSTRPRLQDLVVNLNELPLGGGKSHQRERRVAPRADRDPRQQCRVTIGNEVVFDKRLRFKAPPSGGIALAAYTGGIGRCTVYYDNVVVTPLAGEEPPGKPQRSRHRRRQPFAQRRVDSWPCSRCRVSRRPTTRRRPRRSRCRLPCRRPRCQPRRRRPRPSCGRRRRHPSSFEGRYRSAASSVEIQVTRLFGDACQLAGSDGLEGVGFVDGGTYRGVFGTWRRAPEWRARNRARGPAEAERADKQHEPAQLRGVLKRGSPPLRVVEGSAAATAEQADRRDASSRGHEGDYVYVEELPEAITKVKPVYPDEARRAGVTGTVMVQAHVREDGTVGECRVVKSIPELDAAAIAAVRQWRFKPAMSKGVPVAVPVAVPVKFPPDWRRSRALRRVPMLRRCAHRARIRVGRRPLHRPRASPASASKARIARWGRARKSACAIFRSTQYYLVASDGWEALGMVDRRVYRGVFRYNAARDSSQRGVTGLLTFDVTPANRAARADERHGAQRGNDGHLAVGRLEDSARARRPSGPGDSAVREGPSARREG